jgi:hypothetical protein
MAIGGGLAKCLIYDRSCLILSFRLARNLSFLPEAALHLLERRTKKPEIGRLIYY